MFTTVQINPHFDGRSAYLSWGFSDLPATFLVQRSIFPAGGFTTIGTSGTDLFYQDNAMVVDSNLEKFYYKIIAQKDGRRFDSFPVSWGTNPVKDVYGGAAAALVQEERSLRRQTPVRIFKAIQTGPLCPECMDPETGQTVATSSCRRCYGTGYDGGFHPESYLGHARVARNTEGKTQSTPAGSDSPVKVMLRILPFPILKQEDLIEDTSTSELYVVDSFTLFRFAGRIPVACDAMGTLVSKSDIRYRLPYDRT